MRIGITSTVVVQPPGLHFPQEAGTADWPDLHHLPYGRTRHRATANRRRLRRGPDRRPLTAGRNRDGRGSPPQLPFSGEESDT